MIISPAFNRFVQPEFLSQTGVTSLFEFNDPRNTPKRALSKPAARTTGGPKDLSDLHRLCRDNRLYVWIIGLNLNLLLRVLRHRNLIKVRDAKLL
jgi:hypothetical protein